MGKSSPSVLDLSPMIRAPATMAAAVWTGPHSLDLPRALQDMEERPEGFLKGWICYD